MTLRGFFILTASLMSFLFGLASGTRFFYIAAVFGVLALLYSGFGLLLLRLTLRCEIDETEQSVPRGGGFSAAVRFQHRSYLAPASWSLDCRFGEERFLHAFVCHTAARRPELTIDLPGGHVGCRRLSILSAACSDPLHLFRCRVRLAVTSGEMLVLPRPFEAMNLEYAGSDDGSARGLTAAEDASYPDSTRAWRSGDPLKRIHWKLSACRGELIVRSFETPAPPGTLILTDCSAPAAQGEEVLLLRDALTETALSAADIQLSHQSPVRMPFYDEKVAEFRAAAEGSTEGLKNMLARLTFSSPQDFGRVLLLEARAAISVGAVIIITTRLSALLSDAVRDIRRMGPNVRVYLITANPNEADPDCISQLLESGSEVCYVTPA